jgi:hypothetical protein
MGYFHAAKEISLPKPLLSICEITRLRITKDLHRDSTLQDAKSLLYSSFALSHIT